jgi:separase
LQSLRLWNRALASIERFNAPSPVSESNPFAASNNEPEKSDALQTARHVQPKATFRGIEWQLSIGLLNTLLSLSELYFARGSAREAEYFAGQAEELAIAVNAPAMLGSALARKGEIQLQLGQQQLAYATLVKAAETLGNREGPELADVHRIYADLYTKDMKEADAQQLYGEATSMLENLGRRLLNVDGIGLRLVSTRFEA